MFILLNELGVVNKVEKKTSCVIFTFDSIVHKWVEPLHTCFIEVLGHVNTHILSDIASISTAVENDFSCAEEMSF